MADRKGPHIVSSLVVNALDLFADRVKAPSGRKKSALQKLAATWKELDDAEREQVAEKIGMVAELAAAAIPLAVAAARTRRERKRGEKKDDHD